MEYSEKSFRVLPDSRGKCKTASQIEKMASIVQAMRHGRSLRPHLHLCNLVYARLLVTNLTAFMRITSGISMCANSNATDFNSYANIPDLTLN